MTFAPGDSIKALIFDIDGTLLDTMTVHWQAWRETMAAYGIDMTRELFDRLAGQTSPNIVRQLEREFESAFTFFMHKTQSVEVLLGDTACQHCMVNKESTKKH